MNKAELVDAVSSAAETTKKDAELIINIAMQTIIQQVSQGRKVTLVGFGAFGSRSRKARVGRNPKTGESVVVPAKTIAAFKAGTSFAKAVSKKR